MICQIISKKCKLAQICTAIFYAFRIETTKCKHKKTVGAKMILYQYYAYCCMIWTFKLDKDAEA